MIFLIKVEINKIIQALTSFTDCENLIRHISFIKHMSFVRYMNLIGYINYFYI